MACEDDFDCPLSELCYLEKDASWLPANVTSLCGCSTWAGMVGNDCTGFSTQTGILMSIVISVLLVATLALTVNVWLIGKVTCSSALRKVSTQTVTLAFLNIALLGLLEWRGARLASFYLPNRTFPAEALPYIEYKVYKARFAEKFGLGVASLFSLLAALNLSIRWIEVARTSARMVNMDSSLWGAKKRWIYAFQVLFIIVASVSTGVARLEVAIFAMIPLLVFVFSTYLYALVKLNAILTLLDPAVYDGSQGVAVKRSTGAESKKSLSESQNATIEHQFGHDSPAEDEPNLQRSNTPSRLAGNIAQSARRLTTTTAKASRILKGPRPKTTYFELLSRVRRTVAIVVLGGVLFTAFALLFAVPEAVYGFRDACPLPLGPNTTPGLCWIAIWDDMMSVAIFIIIFAVQNNVRDDILAKIATSSRLHAIGTTTNTTPSKISH